MFLAAVPILVIAFLLTLLIREVPLRTNARGIPAEAGSVGVEMETGVGGPIQIEAAVGSDRHRRVYPPNTRGQTRPAATPATKSR